MEHTEVKRIFKTLSVLLISDMREQHYRRTEHGAGICVLAASLRYHAGSGAVNSLEHRILAADICGACGADTALKFRSLVGDDIAVEVRQNEHAEIAAALLVDELCRCDVDVPLIGGYLGIILGYLTANVEEFSVGGLDNIRLCNDRNSALLVCSRVLERAARDAAGALGGCNAEVYREIVGHMLSL